MSCVQLLEFERQWGTGEVIRGCEEQIEQSGLQVNDSAKSVLSIYQSSSVAFGFLTLFSHQSWDGNDLGRVCATTG